MMFPVFLLLHQKNQKKTKKHLVLKERSSLGIKFGLERVQRCLKYLSNPQDDFKSVLIAGTNGKGSVTFYLSNLACKFTNLKIGRFISPHLISWTERFVINEKIVDEKLLNETFGEVTTKIKAFEADTNEMLTEFELYTVLAFYLFSKEKVDIVFLEVGMGGRLDATNVVSTENTLCSVITNVSYDHMEYLGDTLEKITYEKAGIIKENSFTITGATGNVLKVIEDVSIKQRSRLLCVKVNPDDDYKNKNIKIAKTAWGIISKKLHLKKDLTEIETYLKNLQFSGRFQYFKDEKILMDGAHNPEAAIELKKLLDKTFSNKEIVYIIGILNKDYKSFIENLMPEGSVVICTEPKSNRATKKEALAEYVSSKGFKSILANNLSGAISLAKSKKHDLILITGSLYLVGEALELIEQKRNEITVFKETALKIGSKLPEFNLPSADGKNYSPSSFQGGKV